MVRVAGHGRMPSRPLVRDDPVDDEYVLDESDVLGISSHAKIVGCTHKATGTRRACKVGTLSSNTRPGPLQLAQHTPS
jgi:hypothetical protein